MKFSFIIPVYNTGNLVEICIRSIVQARFENYEMICINDGSTDDSWETMKELTRKYPQLKIFEKNNGGLSETRNMGISLATGEYIMFLDSDDWVDGHRLRELASHCDGEKDIIHGNFLYSYADRDDVLNKSQLEISSTGQELIAQALLQDKFSIPVCMNFYKTEFLHKYQLVFKVGIYHEDEEFNLRAFSYANKVISTNIYFYYYLQRENSITNDDKKVPKRLKDIVKIYQELNEFLLNQSHISEAYRKTCQTYLSFVLIIGYAKIKDQKLANKFKKQIKNMKIYKTIFSNILIYRLSKVALTIYPSGYLMLFRKYFQIRNKKL